MQVRPRASWVPGELDTYLGEVVCKGGGSGGRFCTIESLDRLKERALPAPRERKSWSWETCEVGSVGPARAQLALVIHLWTSPLTVETNKLVATIETNSANSNHQGNKKRKHVHLFPRAFQLLHIVTSAFH